MATAKAMGATPPCVFQNDYSILNRRCDPSSVIQIFLVGCAMGSFGSFLWSLMISEIFLLSAGLKFQRQAGKVVQVQFPMCSVLREFCYFAHFPIVS